MTEKEFTDLIDKHRGVIYKTCETYCRGYDRNDLIQDILLQAWRSTHCFNYKCTFSSWLYNIARNVCITTLRKHKRKPDIIGIEDYVDILPDVVSVHEAPKQLPNAMRYEDVISTIDDGWNNAFQMYIEGIPFKEIAEQTGVNEVKLRVNMHRIKKQLFLKYGKNQNTN